MLIVLFFIWLGLYKSVCFPWTHAQGIHVFVVLSLPIFRQNGENWILCNLTSKLFVQPISKQVLGILQQHLERKDRVNELISVNSVLFIFPWFHKEAKFPKSQIIPLKVRRWESQRGDWHDPSFHTESVRTFHISVYGKRAPCVLSLTWARGWRTSCVALPSIAACRGCRAAVTAASSLSSICFLSGSVVSANWAWKGWKQKDEHCYDFRPLQPNFIRRYWRFELRLTNHSHLFKTCLKTPWNEKYIVHVSHAICQILNK